MANTDVLTPADMWAKQSKDSIKWTIQCDTIGFDYSGNYHEIAPVPLCETGHLSGYHPIGIKVIKSALTQITKSTGVTLPQSINLHTFMRGRVERASYWAHQLLSLPIYWLSCDHAAAPISQIPTPAKWRWTCTKCTQAMDHRPIDHVL